MVSAVKCVGLWIQICTPGDNNTLQASLKKEKERKKKKYTWFKCGKKKDGRIWFRVGQRKHEARPVTSTCARTSSCEKEGASRLEKPYRTRGFPAEPRRRCPRTQHPGTRPPLLRSVRLTPRLGSGVQRTGPRTGLCPAPATPPPGPVLTARFLPWNQPGPSSDLRGAPENHGGPRGRKERRRPERDCGAGPVPPRGPHSRSRPCPFRAPPRPSAGDAGGDAAGGRGTRTRTERRRPVRASRPRAGGSRRAGPGARGPRRAAGRPRTRLPVPRGPAALTSRSARQFREKSSGAFGGRATTSPGPPPGVLPASRPLLLRRLLFLLLLRGGLCPGPGSARGSPGARLRVSALAMPPPPSAAPGARR